MGIELLAPGGSFDAVKAAVSSGADAVYIGASRFSARQNAINFDSDELKRAVSYCHIRGVKVYLAINTLIHDNEFCEALSVAKEAYVSGIDAYIVQDLGLCQALSENFDAPVHGSTQMTVFDENGLNYLKKMGIKRAVLSRECRKAEIAQMAKTSGMEIEVFCHGAICMSYSGQCLMSSFLGGRSANRGECAQPCRLPYSIEGKGGYFLSPRDLSLLSEIPDLINMGVSSLKIEGRMKGPSYVASAVTAFRKTIDRGYADEEDKERLIRAFSRGGEFTKGCYGGIKGVGMMNIASSNDDVLKTNDAALIKE
ncbi:MAG: peptidase U32 family protein, partial [Clostridia bacterium]|nr:peptidase U32 family protein [Clostridia bacterium]